MNQNLFEPHLNSIIKRQRLLSKLIIVASLVVILSSIPEFIFLVTNSIIVILITLGVFSAAYYFNYKNRTNQASNILIFCLSILIFVQTLQLGTKSFTQVYFLPVIISIPFLIENKKMWVMLLHLAHVIIFCSLSFVIDDSFLSITPSNDFNYFNGPLNMICSILMCGFFVWLMVKDNNKSEQLLWESSKRLQEQNDELSKTNRELDHLVYSISHDLRAPIASALGLIELAKMEDDPKKLQYYEELKESCLKRLDNFIIDILNYLKNNRLSVNIEEVNIKSEIDFVVNMNSSFQQNIKINTDLEAIENFHTDRNRLRIILNNLISNSFRYARLDEEEKYVNIKSRIKDNELIITIQDNGIGIHPQHLSKIFDMFFKTSEKTKGSGLGLYITKEALEKIHGRIEVSSLKGIGSTFTIYLPDLIDLIGSNQEIDNKTEIKYLQNELA